MNVTCIHALFSLLVTIDGGWGTWSLYGACSKTCGIGIQYRTRACNNPAPSNGGLPCDGSASESKSCFVRSCPREYYSRNSKNVLIMNTFIHIYLRVRFIFAFILFLFGGVDKLRRGGSGVNVKIDFFNSNVNFKTKTTMLTLNYTNVNRQALDNSCYCYGRAWMAQLVRSLCSDDKVPRDLNILCDLLLRLS